MACKLANITVQINMTGQDHSDAEIERLCGLLDDIDLGDTFVAIARQRFEEHGVTDILSVDVAD